MQNNGVCDGERTGVSKLCKFTSNISRNKYIAHLILGLSFLCLTLFSLVACSADPACSANTLNAACPALVTTGHRPTKKPKAPQHQGGAGMHQSRTTLHSIAAGSQIINSLPFLSDEQLAMNDVVCYDALVLESSDRTNRMAYNRLISILRDRVPFSDFIKNPNYTLYRGCWRDHLNHKKITRVNSSTWIVVLPMTKVDCTTLADLGQYLWLFRIQITNNLPEIVGVALVLNQS